MTPEQEVPKVYKRDIEKAKRNRKAKRRDMNNSGKLKELYARINELKKEKKIAENKFEKLKTEFLKFLRNEKVIIQESEFFKMHAGLSFDFVEALESFRKVGMYSGAYDIKKPDFEVIEEVEEKTGQGKYRKLLEKKVTPSKEEDG
jgi:hypothetical protein